MDLAATLIEWSQYYLVVGIVVAAAFLTFGIDRIDEDARGAYAFRPLLIPGVLLIWPIVLWRWLREEVGAARWNSRFNPPRNAHFAVAWAMGLAVVITLGMAFFVKQPSPTGRVPVLLIAPEDSQP